MKGYIEQIETVTVNNTDFRRVLWTGTHTQLVLMSIPVGGDIGVEVHNHVDQFFRVEQGKGIVIMDKEEFHFEEDFAFIVPAGVEHNVINTGDQDLKLYTLYSPPNHLDSVVHATKEDAEADHEDEAFGHRNN